MRCSIGLFWLENFWLGWMYLFLYRISDSDILIWVLRISWSQLSETPQLKSFLNVLVLLQTCISLFVSFCLIYIDNIADANRIWLHCRRNWRCRNYTLRKKCLMLLKRSFSFFLSLFYSHLMFDVCSIVI